MRCALAAISFCNKKTTIKIIGFERLGVLRLETMGSPALGHGSNCKLQGFVSSDPEYQSKPNRSLQGIFKMLINFHDSSLITTSIAVVRCFIAISIP